MKKLYSILSIVGFIALWQVLSSSGIVNPLLFPPPSKVWNAFLELQSSGELFPHLISSMKRVLVGLLIGSSVGVAFGLITGRIPIADHSLSPIFNGFRSLPPVALIPLIITWFGIGESAKIFSIAFAVFFPVWINTHIGASRVPAQYLRATALLIAHCSKGYKIYAKWVKLIIPASLPFITAGIRTGIAVAFIMVFVSELAGASSGVGYLIAVSHLAYRIDNMIVGIVLLGILGALTDYLFLKITRRFFPWLERV